MLEQILKLQSGVEFRIKIFQNYHIEILNTDSPINNLLQGVVFDIESKDCVRGIFKLELQKAKLDWNLVLEFPQSFL